MIARDFETVRENLRASAFSAMAGSAWRGQITESIAALERIADSHAEMLSVLEDVIDQNRMPIMLERRARTALAKAKEAR
jgi:hypothetical protein